MRGLYIVIDGIDGAGKGTQVRLLNTALRKRGYGDRLCLTREPGASSIGPAIRQLLNQPMDGVTELFLFCADRRLHIIEIIKPALEVGGIVISDRGFSTTYAIQGEARGLNYEVISRLTGITVEGCKPNAHIILDLPVEVALKRIQGRKLGHSDAIERFDDEALDFHRRVREGFRKFSEATTGSIIINADRPPEKVHESVLRYVMTWVEESSR